MSTEQQAARQFSFRLPPDLVDRVERCTDHIRDTGLDLTRADVVRLLLKHALDASDCDLGTLLGAPSTKSSKTKKRRRS